MKKIALFIVTLVAIMIQPIFAQANNLSSKYAQIYYDLINENNVGATSSYLLDFDGDGIDELMLVYVTGDETRFKIYSGSKCVVDRTLGGFEPIGEEDFFEGNSFYICKKAGDNNLYICIRPEVKWVTEKFFTLKNGQWSQVLTTGYHLISFEEIYCYLDGVSVSESEYHKTRSLYSDIYFDYSAQHSVLEELRNQFNSDIDINYNDIISTISNSEKTKIFDELLYPFNVMSYSNIDFRTATDTEILEKIYDVFFNSNKPFNFDCDVSDKYPGITKDKFNKLTVNLFGRTLNFSKFEKNSHPIYGIDFDTKAYYYNNAIYFYPLDGDNSFPGTIKHDNLHLFDIGKDYYLATYNEYLIDDGRTTAYKIDIYSSIVKKNENGSYGIVKTYPVGYIPTNQELQDITTPSSWAKQDIDTASKLGLIPNLTGSPSFKENITRLQFVELAVNLIEKSTGKTLEPANISTFTDTKDTNVLKAYKAGIVNGTSSTTFSPYQSITREQLATMLWNTIDYIQKDLNVEVYTKNGTLNNFKDKNLVSSWAKDSVTKLVANDIMNGVTDTQLAPKKSCTVEQGISLINRVYSKLK